MSMGVAGLIAGCDTYADIDAYDREQVIKAPLERIVIGQQYYGLYTFFANERVEYHSASSWAAYKERTLNDSLNKKVAERLHKAVKIRLPKKSRKLKLDRADELLKFLQKGDTLYVPDLDRSSNQSLIFRLAYLSRRK